ncbi:hypothetical protein FB45DRAFT_927981 [Roridomyces roridus]|uniref:Tautomerase cis-CaaD-like domain-containing protein n=1 Tax=Roridomyces roridus TaxID=1738132 RepID=A0AAD7FIJ0_9AGAR|nr:hypothetical protein FB45DRAFT_927981 [Roridomyces roridus]
MPIYDVFHSYPLTDVQCDDLARRITDLHTSTFTVTSGLVHVRFTEYGEKKHYMGGKKMTGQMNMVVGKVRTGSNRSQDQWEALCRQIEAAWIASVGADVIKSEPKATLAAVFVHGGLAAVYEQGFMAPVAGKDGEWLCKNFCAFEKLAEAGNPFFQDMVAEIRAREDLSFVLKGVA